MKPFSSLIVRERVAFLLCIDIFSFVVAFLLLVNIRYPDSFGAVIKSHGPAFILLLFVWLFLFYALGLYDLRILRNSYDLTRQTFTGVVISFSVSAFIFYAFPLGITPKVNLLLFSSIFFFLDTGLRVAAHLRLKRTPHRVLLIATQEEMMELSRLFTSSPHLGYTIVRHISNPYTIATDTLKLELITHTVDTIIIKRSLLKSLEILPEYARSNQTITIVDLAEIYEILFKKLLLCDEKKYKFLKYYRKDSRRVSDRFKKFFEASAALFLILILLPILLLVLVFVRITSGSPAFYSQTRIGLRGTVFRLFKFRTMMVNAEQDGPQWSTDHDARVTRFGSLLRRMHLDELPQLINILKGEMSFVGPRPERPEFVHLLETRIPLYRFRHIVPPGLTGWAQINYPYGSSVNDSREKLMYDLYYIKKRSFTLDMLILLRSFKLLFQRDF